MKTELTQEEREELVDSLARWAVRMGIEDFVAFMLEVNRPMGVLTGNALIAAHPVLRPAISFPMHEAGLLLQESGLADDFRARVQALKAEGVAKGGA